MRRAKTRKRRHQIDAAIVCYAACKRFGLGGLRYQAQIITQPLNEAAGNEYRPFQRIMPLAIQLIQYRRQQAVTRLAQCRAGLREHKGAGPKGRLGLPNGKAPLPDGRGLLVTCHARNADCAAEMFWQGRAKVACAIGDFW